MLSGRSVLFTTCSLLVHHSVSIELNVPSYRVEKAKQAVNAGKSTTDEALAKNS